MGVMGELGRWGDGEQGKRLKVKGKRNKFSLSPFPFTPFPFPRSLYPLPHSRSPIPLPPAQKIKKWYKRMTIVLIEIF